MKARLHLTIEKSLIFKIKALAEKENTSVSKLVETYFNSITQRRSVIDILKELPKPKYTYPDDFNFQEEYYEDNKKKYGF